MGESGGNVASELIGTFVAPSSVTSLRPPSPASLIAPGGKLRLINVTTTKPPQWIAHGNQAPAYTWAEWDWAGWYQPQILQAAQAGGVNAIRLIGAMGGIVRGQLTLAQYLSRWAQLIEYAASLGLWVYPAGEGFGDYDVSSQAFAENVIGASAALYATFPNVFAFDLVNEGVPGGSSIGLNTPAAVAAYVQTLAAASKSAAPNLPVTTSSPTSSATTSNAIFSDSTTRALLAAFVDYWDYHVYYDALATDVNPLVTDPNYKPYIIGECGQTWSSGSPGQTSRMAGLRAILERPDCQGGGVWTITDQDTLASDAWGVWQQPGMNLLGQYESGFENNNINGVVVGAHVSLAVTSTNPIAGTYSAVATATSAGSGTKAYFWNWAGRPIQPGASVTMTVLVAQTVGTPSPCNADLIFKDANNTTLLASGGSSVTPSTNPGAPSTITVTATAPAGSVTVIPTIQWGSATTAIGDALMFDTGGVTSSLWQPRPSLVQGLHNLPAYRKAQRLTLSDADLTLNGGAGVWSTSSNYTATHGFGVPVRLRIRLTMDAQVNTATDVISGRVLVDGVAIDARVAKFAGATIGAEGTVVQEWAAYIEPFATHSFTAQFSVTGTGTTDKVIGANTQVVIEAEAA